MEFKQRLRGKQKAGKDRNRMENGYRRIKVRGRKRWIKVKSEAKPKA